MLVNTELLNFYIERSGLRIDFICDKLGLSWAGFDKKRKGEIPFRAAEVYVLKDLLRLTDDEASKVFLPKKLGED